MDAYVFHCDFSHPHMYLKKNVILFVNLFFENTKFKIQLLPPTLV